MSIGILCLTLCFAFSCTKKEKTPEPTQTNQKKVRSNKSGSARNTKTLLAPEDLRASIVTDPVEKTFDFANGTYHFVHRYNTLENKPYSMTLTLVAGNPMVIEPNNSNDTIALQKMPREFFNESVRCANLAGGDFTSKVMCSWNNITSAMSDCVKQQTCKHCWMQDWCN